jgi:hypothetical protein
MHIRFLVAALALASAPTWAGDFATCILDNMPGASNGATNAAVLQSCSREHPGRYSTIKKGSGRGLFGFDDGNACVIKKAKDTSYQPAAIAISSACRCLYDKAQSDGEMCANFFDQFDR